MAAPWEKFRPAEPEAGPWAKFQKPEVLGVPADIASDPLLQFDGYQMTPEGFVAAPAPEHFGLGDAEMALAQRNAVRDMIGVERIPEGKTGDLLEIAGGALLRIPELLGSLAELPVNIGDAVSRALGGDPEQSIATAGIRQVLDGLADTLQAPAQEYREAGLGAPSVSGADLVESLNPYANANRREEAAAFAGEGAAFDELTMGERLGNVGRFALEQSIASAPDMAAAATVLPAYIASRSNEIAEKRAENDERADVGLSDLAIGGAAAIPEALLERFTTQRLLSPSGAAADGVLPALGRLAKETGLQGSLGGIEELFPYFAEYLGTEAGATPEAALEAFAGGAVAEGALGGTSQVAQEALARVPSRPSADTTPDARIDPALLQQGNESLGDVALDELLLRNLPPEVVEAAAQELGLGDLNPAPAATTPTPSTERASPSAQELAARMRMESQGQAARAAQPDKPALARPAPEVAGAPEAPAFVPWAESKPGDLVTHDTRLVQRGVNTKRQAEAVAAESGGRVIDDGARQFAVVRDAPVDDTPDPPANIRYGKRRKPPTAEELAARETTLREQYAPAELVQAEHSDPGEAPEPATPAVVADAVQASAVNTPRNLGEARQFLLGKVDEAAAGAPDIPATPLVAEGVFKRWPPERQEAYNRARVAIKDAGFVTFDVPGDGTFKVRNNKAALADFRDKVAKSPGFKERGDGPAKPRPPSMSKRDETTFQSVIQSLEATKASRGLDAALDEASRWQGDPSAPEVKAASGWAAIERRRAQRVEPTPPAERDFAAESDALTARATAILPEVDALSNEDALIVAEAIGGMKARDRRDPHDYIRNQHPDDIREGLDALASRKPAEALESVEPFVSAAVQAIEEGRGAPKRGDAAAWKGWLDGAVRRGDMKQSERDWLGIDDFITQKGAVTREELAEFVRANQVQVQDVVLGEQGGLGEIQAAFAREGYSINVEGPDAEDMGATYTDPDGDDIEFDDLPASLQAVINENSDNGERRNGETKFANYQLPGGENYRELLLTLPEKGGGPVLKPALEFAQGMDGWNVWDRRASGGTGEFVWRNGEPTREAAEARALQDSMLTEPDRSGNFRSSHFDQPNILAHVRFNERTDADGKRVLFLEEIQSDWHQAGRKKGYAVGPAQKPDTAGWRAEEATIYDAQFWRVFKADGQQYFSIPRADAATPAAAIAAAVEQRMAGAGNAQPDNVPDAPFKATDEWAMLAFKRMVRHAAENGFDRIAWTTGEQQAERYDLSKQVERISWAPRSSGGRTDGGRAITIKQPNGLADITFNVTSEGVVHASDGSLHMKPVDEVVGKDMAEKIMAEPSGDLSGDGLKVGGSGMRAFYDSILPKAVNKWAKRFGGRVGQAWVRTSKAAEADADLDLLEQLGREIPGATRGQDVGMDVHAIDLTPAMREAALAGLPLFNTEPTPDEAASFTRQRERGQVDRAQQTARAELSRQRGESDAAAKGLREAVESVLGPAGAKVTFLRGMDGLPEHVRTMLESRNRGRTVRTAALYDPETGNAYVLTDVVSDPAKAAWHAAHEIAGHHGLRSMIADQAKVGGRTARESLDVALDIALQNPSIGKLADAIGKERASRDRLLMAEEAIAELAAATRTGNYEVLRDRYGVEVPQAQRNTLLGAITRFVQRIRAIFNAITGQTFTDEQVHELVEGAWRYARGEGATEGGSLESVDPTRDASRFGDPANVQAIADPRPGETWYHGRESGERAFATGRPAFFARDRQSAEWFTQGEGAVTAHTVTAENPAHRRDLESALDDLGYEFGDEVGDRLRADIRKHSPYGGDNDIDAIYIPAVQQALEARGFDSLIVHDTIENTSTEALIVWKPEQIDAEAVLESVDVTPAQSAALAKAGLPVDRRSTFQRARDGLREEWTKLREAARDSDALKQAVFDRFHGLRMAEAELALSPEQSPYIAARMTAGLPSVVEGLLTYGAPKWDGGVLTIVEDSKGLLDALKPVEGRLNEWLGWMVGRRAKLLKSQGREHNLTDADIAALLSLADGHEAAFQAAAKDYLTIKNAVLDVAQEAGLIDPVGRAAWDHAEYIPFYRAENDGAIGPGTRKGLAGQTAGIRTLKGGENALADPLANIIRNFAKLTDAAMKNRATLLAVDQLPALFEPAAREMQPAAIPLDQVKRHLQEQGVPESTIAGMPPQALKGVQRMLSIVPPTGDDVVRVMREGRAEYHRVLDPLVLRSLTSFRQADKSLAMKPLIWFKRLLTTGVTTTAEFVGANFLRDTGSAWVISDDRFIPGWDSLIGAGKTLANDKGAREMMMAGATFLGGNFYDGNPDAAAAALRRSLRKKGLKDRDIEGFMGTIARSPLRLWDAWLKLSGAVENANRRAVYDAALKAGRSRTEAAYMARDLMDFAMQGDAKWIQFFADVLPFFNARLQGLYKLARRGGTKEGRRAMVLRGGVIAMASVALYAWNMLAHKDAYDELEEWDKHAYWHIAPGTEYHVRIPKPFEIGVVFGTAPERGLEAIRYANTGEGDSPSDTWAALIHALTDTLRFNPIPQAALPIAEQWANKSFFTQRPIEDMGDDQLLPEARAEWYTSDTAKLLGQMSGLSPKRIQHLWNGYTAGLGGYVLDASDFLVRKLSDAPERPEMRMAEWPVLGRFLRGGSPGRSKYTTEFYEALDEAGKIEQTVKELWVTGEREKSDALAKEHADLLGERIETKKAKGGFQFARPKALRKVRDQLTGIREEIEGIVLDRNLSAEQKRNRIDVLETRRNKIVREAVQSSGAWEHVGVGKGGKATSAQVSLNGARNAPKMVMVGSWAGLPRPIRERFDDGALGVFDPSEQKVYVAMGMSDAEASFVAYHEIAGHYGLQGALGNDYESVLNRARQNPTVEALADAMHGKAYQDEPNRLALTEEALSELAAARRTGDFQRIEDRWGIRVPESAKPGVRGMVDRVAQLTKRKLADLTGEEPEAYDDEQVYELIEDAWQYVDD